MRLYVCMRLYGLNDVANGLYVLGMSLPVIRSRQNHRGPTRDQLVLKSMISSLAQDLDVAESVTNKAPK